MILQKYYRMFKNYYYFLAIAKHRSISKAAQELFISQPALSSYLKNLEKEIGTDLFDRSSSPMKLTPSGEMFLSYVKAYCETSEAMDREFQIIAAHEHEKFTVGMSAWKSTYFTPRIIPEFLKKYPYIEFAISEKTSTQMERELLDREINICFLNTVLQNDKLTYDFICNERILLVIPAEHKIAKQHPSDPLNPAHLDISLLRNERIFLNEPFQVQHKLVSITLQNYGIPRDRVSIVSHVLTCVQMVEAGAGITFMPELGSIHLEDTNKLAFYTVDEPILSWPMLLAYPTGKPLSEPEKYFIRITKRAIREQLAKYRKKGKP